MLSTTSIPGQEIEGTGWAGPILWLVTKGGLCIHMYDSVILLDEKQVAEGEDLDPIFASQVIADVLVDNKRFCVVIDSGHELSVQATTVESARYFRKGNLKSHVVYENGKLNPVV